MEVALPVGLPDLYKGAVKRLKVTRHVGDSGNPTQLKSESVRARLYQAPLHIKISSPI